MKKVNNKGNNSTNILKEIELTELFEYYIGLFYKRLDILITNRNSCISIRIISDSFVLIRFNSKQWLKHN